MKYRRKVKLYFLLSLMSTIVLSSCGHSKKSEEALHQYQQEQTTIMTKMMENMSVSPTGNASVAFLEGMIPHHASAVNMAESYLQYGGSNEKLKKLAKEIIKTQNEELEEMRKLIKEIQDSGETNEEKEEKYLEKYNEMMAGHEHMNHGSSSSKNVEHAFARGMIMHHQMAVDMAEAILDYTDHESVRKLAQNIVDTQKKEIQEMQKIAK